VAGCNESLCIRPDLVSRFYNDPKVSLFLLDIQNPENGRAGIEVAESIIRARIGWPISGDSSLSVAKTTIVVWSYSDESVEDAVRALAAASGFYKHWWRGGELVRRRQPKRERRGMCIEEPFDFSTRSLGLTWWPTRI
jgi:hypothetical protein